MFSRNQFVVKPPKGTDYFPLGIHKGNRRGSITKYPEVKLVTLKEVADYIATVNDQRLDEVLIVGNYTGGRDIFVTAGDSVRFTTTSMITMGDDSNDNIDDSKLDIYHNGSEGAFVNKAGKISLINKVEKNKIVFLLDEGSGITEYFEADAAGAARLVRYHKDILLKDNVLLNAGDGKDFRFYHTGSHSYLEVGPSAPGNLYIRNRNESGDVIFAADTDGMGTTDTYFMINSSALQTQFFYNLELQDNVKLGLGDSMDMTLRHTGSQAQIHNTTGILDIKSTTGNLKLSSGTQIDIGNNSGVLYTLPLADGTAGQVIKTDGSGNLSFQNDADAQNVFQKIAVSGQNDVEADASNDTLTFIAGTGITLATDQAADSVTFTNSAPNVDQNLYETIAIQNSSGTTNIPATTKTDTFTFKEGTGIILDEDTTNQLVSIRQSSESLHTKGSWLPILNSRVGITQQAAWEVDYTGGIQQGRWHRHGNLVTAMFKLSIPTNSITKSGNNGILYIENFPYDWAAGNAFHSVSLQRCDGFLPTPSFGSHGQYMFTSYYGTHFNSDGAIEIRGTAVAGGSIVQAEIILENAIPSTSAIIKLEGHIIYETNDASVHSTASVDS